MLYTKDQRVFGPHGPGTIAEVRADRDESYIDTNKGFETALQVGAVAPGIMNLLVDSMYGPGRFPYVVQFDCGYRDVYSDGSLEPLADQLYKGCSDICKPTYERKFQQLLDAELKQKEKQL
jgi:hypothetical protein